MFAIFIDGLWLLLKDTKYGIYLGHLIIAALFFADDLALIASSRKKLNKLMLIVRRYFDEHKLTLSVEKSKIMSHKASTGEIIFEGNQELDDISLDEVIYFKYLGVPINSSPYSLYKSFNEQVRQRAQTYTYRVLSLVKTGPNRSELAFSLWNQVALPSILYGTEIFPLTKKTIDEIEKCQSIIGKFILQLPKSSARVVSYIDAGLRPVWAQIAERVLLYARKIMEKPYSFWPKIAYEDSIADGEANPYTKYLLHWKEKTNVFGLNKEQIRKHVRRAAMLDVLSMANQYKTTTFAMSIPGSSVHNNWFKLKKWVSDSGISKIFAQFRSCNSGFGNRAPANDGNRYKLCPLCLTQGIRALNNEV